MAPDIGLCFHRDAPAGAVIEQARAAEELGFDEFWVIEDCFFTAGVSLAAAALTATESLTVGIGIMPAVARNPAITAMEIATLGALAPGRFHAGIGHGVQDWMAQMGARPASPLTTLEETLTVVRSLLAGDEVTMSGATVSMDGVSLAAAPDPVPLVSAGVRGPKSLALSGRCADGTILADFCSTEYLRWALDQIGVAPDRHRVTVFASAAVSPDGNEARQAMSHYFAEVCQDPPVSVRLAPFYNELAARATERGWLEALQAMPPAWWRQIGPIGTPDDAIAYLNSIADAGADSIAIFPNPSDPIDDARLLAETVLPAVQTTR